MTSENDKTELVWQNKDTEVNPPILPFQTIETVNKPRIEEKPLDFDSNNYSKDWKNKLIWGDNKYILSSLKQMHEGQIDLIYIDPPFATGADFSIPIEVGDKEVTKEPSVIEELAYRDTWGGGLRSYLQMMYERLVLIKELLSEEGGIYVHLDWHVGHYIKVLMDEIFGQEQFRNEIIWKRSHGITGVSGGMNQFARLHDTILWYGKRDSGVFNPQYVPYSENTLKMYKYEDEKGKYRLQILRNYSDETIEELKDEGRIHKDEKGKLHLKQYLSDKEGVLMSDVWNDISYVQPNNRENTGFPTQKPEELLKRIIKASTNEGDLVADFFCGSGTTGVAAEKLGRRWIMSDLSRFAIQTTRKRLLSLHNYSKDYDKPAKPFEILNLGNYQKYKFTENGHPPVEEYQHFILELYEATSIEGYSFLQGRKGSKFVHIASIDGIVTEDEVKHATEECRNAAGGQKLDILGWDFEMGLDRMVNQIGEMYGVDINLKTIPKEATEIKDAAEEGRPIKFFDLNYIEINYQIKDKELQLEIKDFVLANPEYIPKEVQESVEGFTDYIDYWAVDFDYQDDTFHNMWQTFRTRDRKQLETSCNHEYEKPGTKKVLVKVIDVFGNDTNELLEVDIDG